MIERLMKHLKTAGEALSGFFNRNSHRRNVLLLSSVYCVSRLLMLHVVDKGGDSIWKWRILRLWYETGIYPAFPPDHHQGRWMVMLPARMLMALFGSDPWVYYIYPVVMGLIGGLAVYFIASRLRNRAAGAAAFALTIFAPKMVDETMQLCPLAPAAAFTMFALLAMLQYFDTRKAVWTLVAGVLLALGYGSKVTMAYWYVPFALGLWLYRPEAERRTIPWRQLILLALGGAVVAAAEFLAFRATFGVRWGRISMITAGHLGHLPDPQYMNLGKYLLSFLRPLSLEGKFVYTFPAFLLTLLGAASALLWLFRRDVAQEKRFAAFCFVWVYLLHCYVVYKVFPFLHPERNHARYLLAMFALGNVLSVCSQTEWQELFRKLPRRNASWMIPVAVWSLTVVFLVISVINPLRNGEHLGRVISQRQLLVRDGRPALLRLRPENGQLEHGEEKYAKMYVVMFAPVKELNHPDDPMPWYEDDRGRSYMLLWGEVPEGKSCPVRVCDKIFCEPDRLVLKRVKNR